MSPTLARFLLAAAAAYLAAGACFAIPFALRWVGRTDPAARDGSPGFRLLLLPGATLLWPLLALRLNRSRSAPAAGPDAHRPAEAPSG